MKYGIQLYSVKNHMMEDVKGTLRQIAEMGYQMVEPAGFFDTPAEDFKAWCEMRGVSVTSEIKRFVMEELDKYYAELDRLHEEGQKK